MAIQNPSGAPSGGTANALALNAATLIKGSAGTFWNINVNSFGQNTGYLCDAATIAAAGPQNAILTIPSAGNAASSVVPLDGPFKFLNGLVFLPGSADLNISVAYS